MFAPPKGNKQRISLYSLKWKCQVVVSDETIGRKSVHIIDIYYTENARDCDADGIELPGWAVEILD